MPSETPDSNPPRERGGVRTVRISEHERSGYSSDRTRRGEPVRDAAAERALTPRRARGRRLAPSNRMSYAPSSVIVLAGARGAGQAAFAERLFDKGSVAVLSTERIQSMIAGDPAPGQAVDLIGRVATQRLRAGQSVVVVGRALDAQERRDLVLIAQRARRPVHLILLEATRDQLLAGGADEQSLESELPAATELRRGLERETLGEEGFSTVLSLTPRAAEQVRQIGFDLDMRASLD